MWQIIINGPGYFDTPYDLPRGATTLGRADENDIVLSGDLVSRRHASLTYDGESLRFEDLGSRNGSRVNGEAVSAPVKIAVGDLIHVGENSLSVRESSPDRQMTDILGPFPGMISVPPHENVSSAVILSKAVRESVVLRALDNVPPMAPRGAEPFSSEGAGDAVSSAPRVDYDSLLLISRVAEALATSTSLSSFLERTVDWLIQQVNATTAVVLRRGADGVLAPAVLRHRGWLQQGEVPVSDGIISEALKAGKAIAVADVRDDQRFARRDSVLTYGAGQVLCIPLGTGEPSYKGVLYLNRSTDRHEGLETILDLCSAVAHLLASGLSKFAPSEEGNELLRGALTRSLPEELAERRMSEHLSGRKSLEELPVTVLFADLAGFSGLTRRLDPQILATVLAQFYELLSNVIFSFEGTLVTFVGDSALSIFGAPYTKGDDAASAVRAALALKGEWQRAMAARPAHERCALKIGLHTGGVLTGIVGSPARRLDYVAVGEPVNTAAWLVGLAGADQILMTAKTHAVVGSRFLTSLLGERPVGGREKLALYEVEGEDTKVSTQPGV